MSNQTLVKICGICDVATSVGAAEAGADFIGLVFYTASTRNVNKEKAKKIVSAIRQYSTKVVGVFVDQNAEEIAKMCKYAGINIAQLHGDNARNALFALPDSIKKIFVINVGYDGNMKDFDLQKVSFLQPERDFLLFDGTKPGSGKSFNFNVLKPDRNFKFFLSGGLNVENVCRAISVVTPFAVDVSSGVEGKRGVKDMELIKKFINTVKGE